MTPQEESLFRNASRRLPAGAILRYRISDDERSPLLSQFCEQLKTLIPNLSILFDKGESSDPPYLLLPNDIRYLGVPTGNEVLPFVEALSGTLPPPADSLRERLHSIAGPAVLALYITPHCTFCPTAVRRLIPLASCTPLIHLRIIDGLMYPELADRDAIQSVPTLVLDGQYRWTGSIPLEETATLMATRDPLALTPAALETMLKQGAAKQLAVMMAERAAVFPALLELLCHEQWPVRLGAMVTMEELNALDPLLAQQVIDPLWQRVSTLPDPVQGDVFHMFGEIGAPALIPRLIVALRDHPSAEVREALQDALEKLNHKKKPQPEGRGF